MGLLVDLATALPTAIRTRTQPLREWRVEGVVTLSGEGLPPVAVGLTIDVLPLRKGYDVTVYRAGWSHSVVLRSRPSPEESEVERARREGAVRLLHEMLSASFGLPA